MSPIAGNFSSFEHVTVEPKPIQPGGVPIWLASNNIEPGLKRVARMADGWLNNITDPKTYKECLGKIRAYAAEAGRDPQAIEPALYFTLAAGDDRRRRAKARHFLSQYYNRPYEAVAKAMLCVMGSWDQVMDQIQAYTEAGARTFVLRFATSDQLTHLENCAEQLAQPRLSIEVVTAKGCKVSGSPWASKQGFARPAHKLIPATQERALKYSRLCFRS